MLTRDYIYLTRMGGHQNRKSLLKNGEEAFWKTRRSTDLVRLSNSFIKRPLPFESSRIAEGGEGPISADILHREVC